MANRSRAANAAKWVRMTTETADERRLADPAA